MGYCGIQQDFGLWLLKPAVTIDLPNKFIYEYTYLKYFYSAFPLKSKLMIHFKPWICNYLTGHRSQVI